MIRSHSLRGAVVALALVAALAAPASAQDDEPSTAYNGAVGVASALCTLVYSPLKVVYATTGLVVTSLAWLWSFGDTDIAGPLFRTTVGGDYVVTPSVIEGDRHLRFRGEP